MSPGRFCTAVRRCESRLERPASRWCRVAAASLAAAGFAGCTLGPDYKRPEVPLPPVWRTPSPAVSDPVAAAELVNTEWWRALGDADLDALIDATIDANKDLAVAALRIEQFDARLQISRAPNYPQVGYSSGASRELRSQERPNGLQPGQSPYVNNYEGLVNFKWELDLWGKVRRANEAARAELLSNQETRRGVMLSVVSGAATTYVQLLELDSRLGSAQQTLKNRREALVVVDNKYRGGSATRLAVEQARAEVETDQANIAPIERDIALLEHALSELAGRVPGPVQRRKLDALALPHLPDGVPADVLTRRPDVMAAEQSLVAANARIGVAKTAYFPALSLAGLLGLGSDDPQWLFAKTARTGKFGASLAGPIFSGGAIEGDIREAEALQRQAVVLFEQAVLAAVKEVEDALVTRSKAAEREAALGRQVGHLTEAAKLARMRYEGGQSSLKEALDADLAVVLAQSGQGSSRRDTLLGLISVYKAMGGGWMVVQEQRRLPPPPDTPPPSTPPALPEMSTTGVQALAANPDEATTR